MYYYGQPKISHSQRVQTEDRVIRKVISQPIITKTLVTQPIIRQRVVQNPIQRRRVVKRPVYTQRIQKDTINKNNETINNFTVNVPGEQTFREKIIKPSEHVIQDDVNVMRGQTQYKNYTPKVEEAVVENKVVEKTLQAPAKEFLTKKYYMKEVNNLKDQIQLDKMPTQYQTEEPVTLEAVHRTENKMVTKRKPGNVRYEQRITQPSVHKETVNVNLKRGDDEYVTVDQMIAPVTKRHYTRLQTVQVPQGSHTTQPIQQNFRHEHTVNHKITPYIRKYGIQQPVNVPVPVIQREEIVKRIEVPVPRDVMKKYKALMKGYEIIDGSNEIHNQELKKYNTTWDELMKLKKLKALKAKLGHHGKHEKSSAKGHDNYHGHSHGS
jgi:hypothetical protein